MEPSRPGYPSSCKPRCRSLRGEAPLAAQHQSACAREQIEQCRAPSPYSHPDLLVERREKGKRTAQGILAPAAGPSNPPKCSTAFRKKRSKSVDDAEFSSPASSPQPPPKHNRERRSIAGTSAVPVMDGRKTIDCGCCGEELEFSLDCLVKHFSIHYTAREKKARYIQCVWEGCTVVRRSWTEIVRHLKKDHLNVRWACPDCGTQVSRIDCVRRHRNSCRACVSLGMFRLVLCSHD